MPYDGQEPEIIRADVVPVSTTNVSAVSSSFDNNILVLGYQNENNNTGAVEVHRYNPAPDTWTSIVTIAGPHTGAYFGKSVGIDWDGERIVVGANAACNVYVYDWDGTTYQNYSNIIQSPSGPGSDFGFSVALAKNKPDVIAIGSPAHNNVFVYQLVTDAWTQTFSNLGTDIQNLAPYSQPGVQVYDATNNLVTTSEYNRYGEAVSISSGGEYIVVGQPGTILSNLNATNTTNYGIVAEGQKTVGNVVVGTSFYIFDSGVLLNKQLGSVRVFGSTDAAWSTSNAQIGGLIYGERNFVIDTNRSPTYSVEAGMWFVNWATEGWSYPAHGSSVDISPDGQRIVVGAPLYGRAISYGGHAGKVYTYELREGVWVQINTILGGKLTRFGLNVKLDYLGSRLAVNGCNNEQDITSVYDFSNSNWYNIRPDIVFFRRGTIDLTLDMTDGKTVIMTRTVRSTDGGNTTGNFIVFYNLELTQLFNGNSLFSGYITTPYLHVGVNDSLNESTSQYSKDKKISFGGTFNDNTYENTTIENRVYLGGSDGLSELILSKVPGSEESMRGLDILRLKGMEIHLDSWNQIDGDKYEHHPILVMTFDSCIGINHSKIDFTNQDLYYNNSIDTHAKLDVNGSTFMRNKLNVNYLGRSEILGYNRTQGILFWDTRQMDTVDGTTVYSRSWPAPTRYPERYVFTSTMIGNVSYSPSDGAFYFGTGGTLGSVDTGNNDSLGSSSEKPKVSMWLKIGNDQSTYTNKLIWSYGTTVKADMILTTTGLRLTFSNGTSTYTADATYAFTTNKWYNIMCELTQKNVTTPTNTVIYINNFMINTFTGSGTAFVITTYERKFVLGNGVENAYMGMVNLWTSYVNRAPTSTHLYENGPPDELLSVGGTAVVSGKLAVGTTNPTKALEVVGDASFTGSVTAGSFVGALDAGNVTTGTLAVLRGGTGVTTSTGTGSVVLSASPTISDQILFGNSNHGVGRNSSLTYFTDGNDIVLYTAGTGESGFSTDFGNKALKLDNTGGVTLVGGLDNSKITIGPNSLGAYLVLGTNSVSASSEAHAIVSNGNLHLDPKTGYSIYLNVHNGGNTYYAGALAPFSDDRLKTDEVYITNAIETINRLRPQTYMKSRGFGAMHDTFFESGLIAQEIYYGCPELKHLVAVPKDASPNEDVTLSDDPQIDPDYGDWGTTPAAVNYTGIIPYLIKANQELHEKILQVTTQLQAEKVKITSVLERLDALEATS